MLQSNSLKHSSTKAAYSLRTVETVMALRGKFAWTIILLQLFFIVIFAIFGKYGAELDAAHPRNNKSPHNGGQDPKNNSFGSNYPVFQDVNAMVFLGIGYLYAFLWKYSYSGVGMNFLLCAITVQWGLITYGWWRMRNGKIEIDIISLLKGEFAAASAVIGLGGIFGKVGYLQMIIFSLFEVLAYSTVKHYCYEYLQVSDVGESVTLHLFAAIFGCSAAYVVDRKVNVENNPNERHSYNSNLFCLIGTIILWIYWPSFNCSDDEGDSQHRNMVNTFLALLGSALLSFATSSLLHEDNKLTMSHIQNGALAGAVGIGSTSNLMLQPFGALLIGALSGCLCVAGFKYFSPFLGKLHIYDPCGINSLHGLPGLFAGILAIFATFLANAETYGFSLYKFYPAMAPPANTSELMEIQRISPRIIEPGMSRTAQSQALYQFIYVIAVMVASCLMGLITGAILRLKILDPIEDKHMYLDEIMFDTSDIEIIEVREHSENRTNQTKEK